MRLVFYIIILLGLSSCLQTENSSTSDAFAGGDNIRTIFSNNCASCHDYHQKTDEQLIDYARVDDLVIPGDPEASQIYYRLVGSIGGPAGHDKDMPQGGALSESEVIQIRTWIEGL